MGLPTMRDRDMQALYLLALDPIAETTGDPNSYGFRQERSTADAIAQCFIALGKNDRPQWVLEGDIKSCFDRISHDWLLAHVPLDRAILRQWLKAGFMERGAFHPTDAGTPQGGILDLSHNVANTLLQYAVTIPREQLRPGYGAGFQGAPLRPAPPAAAPARREGGEGDGAARSKTTPGADGAPGV